jgi:hypothetical protein
MLLTHYIGSSLAIGSDTLTGVNAVDYKPRSR